jgi:hypothetical protein
MHLEVLTDIMFCGERSHHRMTQNDVIHIFCPTQSHGSCTDNCRQCEGNFLCLSLSLSLSSFKRLTSIPKLFSNKSHAFTFSSHRPTFRKIRLFSLCECGGGRNSSSQRKGQTSQTHPTKFVS